jgi:hypothetical protein
MAALAKPAAAAQSELRQECRARRVEICVGAGEIGLRLRHIGPPHQQVRRQPRSHQGRTDGLIGSAS